MQKTITNAIQIAMQANVPVLAWGPPGVGKTSFIEAVAKSLGVPAEVVIASIHEPSDFGGLPIVSEDKEEKEDNVKKAPPLWAKRLKKEGRGILFLDELSTAPPAVQAACLRVVLDRWVGDMQLPENISIIAAANPPEIAAGGWDLSPPLANRFCHLNWELDAEEWVNGMVSGWPSPKVIHLPKDWQKEIPAAYSLVSSFINSQRTLLLRLPDNDSQQGLSWPSPRSWEMAAKLLAACTALWGDGIKAGGAVREEVTQLMSGCVGDGPALEFVNFMKDLDLPDPEHLLKHPKKLDISVYNRHDRLFAVLSSVTSAVIANNTPNRWHAGWFVLEHVVNQGAEDVAAQSAYALAKNIPDGAHVPKALACFEPILKEAGLWGNA